MKSLFKKFSTAVIVLAAVALLSVPLLGGARLAADCGRIEKKFNHFATETDKHGNNFESDMVVFAANAESLCDEAARITGRILPPCAAFKTILPNTKSAVPHLKNLIASNVCLRMQSAFMPPFRREALPTAL